MKKLNLSVLSKLSNTFASLRYFGEVKMVKKARVANEVLTKAIADHGGKVAEVGSPCPFKTVMKANTYTVSIGAKLQYKRKVEAMTKRNGVETDYHPEVRNMGMFPIFGELLWMKNDLSEVYVREPFLATWSVTVTSIGESNNDPKGFFRSHTIKTGVPVLVEILNYIVFECPIPFVSTIASITIPLFLYCLIVLRFCITVLFPKPPKTISQQKKADGKNNRKD